MKELMRVQKVLATLIKEKAIKEGVHGACWVLILPRENGVIENEIYSPSLVLIGDSFKDYLADNKAENHVGLAASMLAKMLDTGGDSDVAPSVVSPAEYINTLGESSERGGKVYKLLSDRPVLIAHSPKEGRAKVYKLSDYPALVALSTNEPHKSTDILDRAVRELFGLK